ncbi:hypothetical protein [Microvirga arabica]|uniref:hypothetical protein n=1 Tax=Microvirga arabica TaxID=1128671 RepID=UPI001939FC46|nr:hypothetical protein [Microvirga arabica]MBM1175412.1 hypothetical protein [Microvirga arabica]
MYRQPLHKRTFLAAMTLLASCPAHALDLREEAYWSLSEDKTKIGLLSKHPGFQNTYTSVMLTCAGASGVRLMLGPVDHTQLGSAISRNQVPDARLVVDGKTFEFPEVSVGFNLHDEQWMYEVLIEANEVETLARAKIIKAQGTGLNLDLPRTDLSRDFVQFRDSCPAGRRSR